MKPSARVINCARGGVVNEQALADAVVRGAIAGAAVDVYSSEPPVEDNPLVTAAAAGCYNLLLTPHLGASTEEAQMKVAVDVAEQIRDYFQGIPARSAVNMPALAPELLVHLETGDEPDGETGKVSWPDARWRDSVGGSDVLAAISSKRTPLR